MAHKYPRVSVFIDGFNLYHGMKDANFRRFLWLDIHLLAVKFLQPGQSLASIYYFTAPANHSDKRKRQTTYLEALETHRGISPILGRFQNDPIQCRKCANVWNKPEEKKTDVAIATNMLMAAVNDEFDAAYVVSGDSDLVPPVEAIRNHWTNKAVFACFPPKRHGQDFGESCNGSRHINKKMLQTSQLPDEVTKPCGYILKRPKSWK